MKFRLLGATGLKVSVLGYGAAEFRGPFCYNGRPFSEKKAGALLNKLLDYGINYIDTSPDYGYSEDVIGRHIACRRKEYFIATKCGCNVKITPKKWECSHIWTGKKIKQNVEESLQRLKTNYLDVLQLHSPSYKQILDSEVFNVIQELKRQGKTRFIGISTCLPDALDFLSTGIFDVIQIPYSCLEPLHSKVMEQAGNAGLGIVVRGGIARGGPDGYQADAHQRGYVSAREFWEIAKLYELLEDMSPPEIILRYTISNKFCHTAIIGTLNEDHLNANIEYISQGPLPQQTLNVIDRRLKEVYECYGVYFATY